MKLLLSLSLIPVLAGAARAGVDTTPIDFPERKLIVRPTGEEREYLLALRAQEIEKKAGYLATALENEAIFLGGAFESDRTALGVVGALREETAMVKGHLEALLDDASEAASRAETKAPSKAAADIFRIRALNLRVALAGANQGDGELQKAVEGRKDLAPEVRDSAKKLSESLKELSRLADLVIGHAETVFQKSR